MRVTVPFGSSRYRQAAPSASSYAIVPAQNRPAGSHLPSLNRSPGLASGIVAILRGAITDDPEAILERRDEAAGNPRRDRADVERQVDGFGAAGRGIGEVHPPPEDVDPDEAAGPDVPDGPLAQLGICLDEDLERVGAGHVR